MVVHRSDAVTLFGLGGSGDHNLLAFRSPYRLEGRHPTQVELVGVVEMISRPEAVAGLFDRLFLKAYSGSGLVMVCWGRLRTIPAAFRCTRTVSYVDPDARAFGHVIGQALQSPKRERHPQATRTATNRVDQRSRYSSVTLRGAPGCGSSRSPSTPSAR